MNKCPICRVPLEMTDYCSENYEETYDICRKGCKQYGFESWCGSYRITLGTTEIVWGYSSTATRRRKCNFIYKRKLARLRKAYRKGKLK